MGDIDFEKIMHDTLNSSVIDDAELARLRQTVIDAEKRCIELLQALTRLEQIYNTDRVAADQACEIETIFDEHLYSSVCEADDAG